MPNMSMKKTQMPELDPNIRNQNFDEVEIGYMQDMAKTEAERCLNCKTRPCVDGCPVGVPIPEFIKKIVEDDMLGAYQAIVATNSLPAICGRVCPQETQCEAKCVRGIKGESVAIGRLERFVADWYMKNYPESGEDLNNKSQEADCNSKHKVAIIGSGPAGLTCAGDLAKKGYHVTVFEALHEAGGVLMYGIPEFRLPKEIVQKEISSLKKMGVVIEKNVVIGRTLSIDDLFEQGYQVVFVGTGAGLPNFMGIPGEGLIGVYSANEFLTRINLMKAYRQEYETPIYSPKKVAVIGGGNVAMDAARSAKRIGAEDVYIVYRRSEAEMPARLDEVHHAKQEGIEFCLLNNPVRIIGDDKAKVSGLECVKMQLGEPDASGRRRPVELENSNFILDVDCVIIAIGNSPNPLIRITTKGIEVNKKGCLVVNDDTMETTRHGVFAGGDAVTGAATVILAMGAGKKAAQAIDEQIKSL